MIRMMVERLCTGPTTNGGSVSSGRREARVEQRENCRLPSVERHVMMRDSIHPGETLKEDLDALGASAVELAPRIEVPVNRITEIINGRRAVTGDTALRPERFFASVGRVLAQPPEALRIEAGGAEEPRGDLPAAVTGRRRRVAGIRMRHDRSTVEWQPAAAHAPPGGDVFTSLRRESYSQVNRKSHLQRRARRNGPKTEVRDFDSE